MSVGIACCMILPPFPDKMKRKHWLFTPSELERACERAACKCAKGFCTNKSLTKFLAFNTIGAKINYKQLWAGMKDPKTWAFMAMQTGVAQGIGTVGVFLPSFVKEFGYSTRK